MITNLATAAAALALLTAGYALGRLRPGERLPSWAEDAAKPGWCTWKFWPAVPIILIALAWVWALHPRRTLANVRSWREDAERRTPAPVYDPNWVEKRKGNR
ncbi:hypothetical protein ACWEWX_11330 [Streptomyces asiaticus]